ncbi:MAG TPA: DNA-binding response regulator [Elusimicrobia bacterium]|nr:DNA-binding response regulator [Elusimicrobiota bacterium]
MKVALLDDDESHNALVAGLLGPAGYDCVSFTHPERLLAELRRQTFDLLIIDWNMPDLSGIETLRRLDEMLTTPPPVLLLTSRSIEADLVEGLNAGADDYIVKPFSMRELQARIESQLRRAAGSFSGAGGVKSLRIGELDIDFERHDILARGKPVRLAPKELALLKVLIEADGKVLSRDRLLDVIWGYGQNLEIDTRTVDQHVARLRRKLGREGARILTVTNAGYKIKMR